jgi:uncharacterized protein YgbK (DUF1537 family)
MTAKRRLLLGCIADDFTGATDLANNLVRAGMRTVQTIGVPSVDLDSDDQDGPDAIVVALKSRTISPQDAVAQSLAALKWLQSQGAEQIYFKYCSTFDSTAEGNIGPVTQALMAALQSRFTVACPAFPEALRTVFKGHLFVADQLLSDSGMRNHPLTPMLDANLVSVLQKQTALKVGLLSYDVVARGAEAVRERFAQLQADGVEVAVLDAISNADLLTLGQALAGMPLVTAGSGIAIGLPQNWRADGGLSQAAAADKLPPATGFKAIISGSCSLATNAQVAHFQQSGQASFRVDALALARGEDLLAHALAWAKPLLALDNPAPLLVYATAEPEAIKDVQAQLGVEKAGALVETALAGIAKGLLALGVRQLVVAGGETSGAVVQALGVTQLAIGPQIAPGVPWTFASMGAQQPLHLALKSGNFGAVDFFTKAFAVIHD